MERRRVWSARESQCNPNRRAQEIISNGDLYSKSQDQSETRNIVSTDLLRTEEMEVKK
jgi:hypothetical protein